MSIVAIKCAHCGTINIVSGAGCVKCGWWLPPKSRNIIRRRFLIGAGAFLVGCTGLYDIHILYDRPLFPDEHLFFEMDWLGWFSFAWSSDSKHLICLKWTGELAILDITSKQMCFLKQRAWNEDLSNSIILHTWSNDRRYLAYSEKFQGIGILDLESGEHVQIQPELHVNAFAWSPDGSQFAYLGIEEGIYPVLSVWNRQGWKMVWKKDVYNEKDVYNRDNDKEASFSWSPDGKYISFSFNSSLVFNSSPTLHVWSVSDGQQLWTQEFSETSGIDWISWSADSSALAVSCLSEYTDGAFDTSILTLSSLPEYSDISLCQGSVWNVKNGQKLFESQLVKSNAPFYGHPSPSPFAWSPNGVHLAFFVQDQDNYVMRVWDKHTGNNLFSSSLLNFRNGSISWSPNGRFIAAGSYAEPTYYSQNTEDYGTKSTIQFWNAQNGQALISYAAPRLPSLLTWSPDSRFLVVINMQTVGCHYGCEYGNGSQNGVGFQRLQAAFQIFQAPNNNL